MLGTSYWVTGSKGFIGGELTVALQNSGFLVSALRRNGGFNGLDLTDREAIYKRMYNRLPLGIYHIAGNPIVRAETLESQDKHIDSNYLSTYNLLSCLDNLKLCFDEPPIFTLASTSTVYGNTQGYEHCELTPTSLYAATKVGAEALVNAYTELGVIKGCICRICATIGPRASHGLIPAVISKLKSESKYLELFGEEPGSYKPFLHIYDCVQAFIYISMTASCNPHNNQALIYNIAPYDNLSVKEVAEIIMSEMDIKKEIKWLGEKSNWKGDNPVVKLTNDEIKRLGFKFTFDTSEQAIRSVVKESQTICAV